MKVTLRKVCLSLGKKPLNLLNVKKELLTFKKQGILFFQEELASLGWNDEFELYYHMQSCEQNAVNAFPVPVNEFYTFNRTANFTHHLKEYFSGYYTNQQVNEHTLGVYDKKPFIAKEYVWFYK